MTSKIINMADKFRDAEDKQLESLFDSGPIADNGFSDQIVRRIRRGIWIRRLTLPIAVLIGGAIAFKPAMQIMTVGTALIGALPQDMVTVPTITLPQLPVILLGVTLLAIGVLTARMLEE